jgi:predicted enzyme related to lactoylglutathione lyase
MLGPIKTIGIYVTDQDAAVAFYTEKLGFVVRRRLSMGPGAEWIEVSPPGAETCLVLDPKAMMQDWHERKPSVVFYAADIETIHRELVDRGVEFTMPLAQMPRGKFAMLVDPDGNEIGITSQELAP